MKIKQENFLQKHSHSYIYQLFILTYIISTFALWPMFYGNTITEIYKLLEITNKLISE